MSIVHKVDSNEMDSSHPSYDSIDNSADIRPHLQEKSTLPEPNYEFDCEAYDEDGPYWEPSSIEEELRAQLGKSGVLDVPKDSIQYATE